MAASSIGDGPISTVQVEIWSDLVCPWCYLGHARFRQALDDFAYRDQVQVVYRSSELDPDFPPGQSIGVLELLSRKYGATPDQSKAAERKIAGLAAEQGLPFEADRSHGNTFNAHRLLHLAARRNRQEPVLAALYRAHFGAERSIFDAEAITDIAAGAGLDRAEAAGVLAGDAYADEVRSDERRASELGITGVPFAVANGKLAVSGAQVTSVFARLLATAWDNVFAAQ